MKIFRIILISILVVAVIAGAGLLYIKKALPDVDLPENVKIEGTPEQLERGKYLATHVAVCIDCHSTRDWSKFSGPIVEGTEGRGGERFGREFGFPGEFFSKNITPAGIGEWTDAEVMRAVTSGVDKNGKALFPVMPYLHYGKMDPEDVKAIIAYIRTLKPLRSSIPESEADFPMSFILNTIPQEPEFVKRPTDPILYGEYLTNMASCIDCHTPMEKGKLVEGREFAGGHDFPLPGFGIVRSSNLTPDEETGIGSWSKEAFIKRFRYYSDSVYIPVAVNKNSMNSIMPWTMYAGMTDDDLGAIYDYLKTLKPVKSEVEKFTPEQKRKRKEDAEMEGEGNASEEGSESH